MKKLLSDFLEFIRFRICIFLVCIGITGYLLFNSEVMDLIFVIISSFLVTAGAYAYNNTTDSREDLANRKKINPFVMNKWGLFIVSLLFLSGIFFSFFLSPYSIFFCLLGVVVSITYSFFRLKEYFLVKNFYTGFGASIVFLLGAGNFSINILEYYLLFSLLAFIGSSISDLRDYEGDKLSNIKTVPVYLGYETGKRIDFVLLGIFSLSILFFSNLVILLPFPLLIFYFLYKNKAKIAHSFLGSSFIFSAFWFLVLWAV